jgi:hypothetical protein
VVRRSVDERCEVAEDSTTSEAVVVEQRHQVALLAVLVAYLFDKRNRGLGHPAWSTRVRLRDSWRTAAR